MPKAPKPAIFSMSTLLLHMFANRVPPPFHLYMKLMQYLLLGVYLTTVYLAGLLGGNSLAIEDFRNNLAITGDTSSDTNRLFDEVRKSIFCTFAASGAFLIPSTFKLTTSWSDAHYSGTIPI